jgi:hypothetical protein
MAALQLAGEGHFAGLSLRESEAVVLLHTGGLQGVAGFNERFGNLIDGLPSAS